MNTLNDVAKNNVLETQRQRHEENKFENKHVPIVRNEGLQKNKLRMRNEKKKTIFAATRTGINAPSAAISSGTTSKTISTNNIIKVPIVHIPIATQFSVERSDSDGCLRMKISAIRPTATDAIPSNLSNCTSKPNKILITKQSEISSIIKENEIKVNNELYKIKNNTSVETLKLKINSKALSEVRQKPNEKLKKMSMTVQRNINESINNLGTPDTGIKPSDATDSGCSEATTRTTAVPTVEEEKSFQRIRIKRKKLQTVKVTSSTKHSVDSVKPQTLSTDSEDEPLSNKIVAKVQPALQQQKAPRLLLTAVNTKGCPSALDKSNVDVSQTSYDHNIGLSSSDNEIPDLVSAVIKRVVVESDDDTTTLMSKNKYRQQQQYQSTLLQDFMEKTQMLGQTQTKSKIMDSETKQKLMSKHAEILVQLNTNSQSDSAASTINTNKRRRGRPKKIVKNTYVNATGNFMISNSNSSSCHSKVSFVGTVNINESVDSGVISTTSASLQSTSPQSTATVNAPAALMANDVIRLTSPCKNQVINNNNNETSTSKLKIDIGLLDRRMYATERVLYPPPRNKRRQSTSALILEKLTNNAKEMPKNNNSNKDDLQLDPVWLKIDVNRKFRRPSVTSVGYNSDGGAEDRVSRPLKNTVCSKILAAKSGYVSDYSGTHNRLIRHGSRSVAHNSGYKSDASGKSRFSIKTCASRRSRAKSCGYRSDCRDSGTTKSSKFRRKRRASVVQRSMGSLKDEQDILQLAGLSLGQSSEESNEYVCKPSLEKLPTTSASKKYGEINRYVATGEYFGRGSDGNTCTATVNATASSIISILPARTSRMLEVINRKGFSSVKLSTIQRKNSTTSEFTPELIRLPSNIIPSGRKIKSRRSSVASYCSSYYSGTTKIKRRRRQKNFRFPSSIMNTKISTIDSKLLTEIEILTNTFATRCRIQPGAGTLLTPDKINLIATNLQKEKLIAEANKLQHSLVAVVSSNSSSGSNRRETRDKRNVKKRKINENLDFAMLSASATAVSSITPPAGSNSKRRHKKTTSSSSPDDHKLPLKKRHYLLTPGDKSSEVAVAVAAKLFANNTEAWAAAAAAAKCTASTKSQQQFKAKTAKANLTPKKRHLLQQTKTCTPANASEYESGQNIKIIDGVSYTNSPLRIKVVRGDPNLISGCKLLDISPHSLNSLKQNSEVNRKRSRLEGFVSKMATYQSIEENTLSNRETNQALSKQISSTASIQLDSETSSCPPPGVFEPSIQLAIQIPSISKLPHISPGASIITKAEVTSPLLIDSCKSSSVSVANKNEETSAVVESLLKKTRGNSLLKRKRKKINRTGFPTVRRRKRKNNEQFIDQITDNNSQQLKLQEYNTNTSTTTLSAIPTCDRVPQTGEATDTFLERINYIPRLSVVALERLQETPGIAIKVCDSTIPITEISQTKAYQSKVQNVRGELNTDPNQLQPIQAKYQGDTTQNEEDDKPLKTRIKRTRGSLEENNRYNELILPIKSVVPKFELTNKNRKSLIDSNVKLPAGIDPNTNFSCKIRLKRRSSVHSNLASHLLPIRETPETKAVFDDIAFELARKDVNINYTEHDVLPLRVHQISTALLQNSDFGVTEEKLLTPSTAAVAGMKKCRGGKKTYLVAGLLSDYYKIHHSTETKRVVGVRRDVVKKDTDDVLLEMPNDLNESLKSLLPPPPYCEKYLRRTHLDFELPYDIWWAYKNCKLPSRIMVPSWNFRKIRTNIYADSVRPPNIAPNDRPMCNCKPDIGCGDNCLNRMVYTECSPANCPTKEKCHNQKIQRHEIAPGVERFMTADKGWGVRTKQRIFKGTYILEYVGEVVTEREFKERMATIYLNDNHHYCLHLDGGLVIDGHRMGSDCRFVNHSCQPNCEMQKWSVNGLSRMALFAKRNIDEGEELTYDYNFSLFNPSEGQPCRCNTPQCRGVIGGKSQRIKPLPIESKTIIEVVTTAKGDHKDRQRKRTARKTIQEQTNKDISAPTRIQPLTEKERRLTKHYAIFLLRNLKRSQRLWIKNRPKLKAHNVITNTTTNVTIVSAIGSCMAGLITHRRPSTPTSLAAQISALCTARHIKTRGLTLAVQDPEVEKMAKMAKIFRNICTSLEQLKYHGEHQENISTAILQQHSPYIGANKRKKPSFKITQKNRTTNLKVIQANIEQGYYKLPNEFNNDVLKLFKDTKRQLLTRENEGNKLKMLEYMEKTFEQQKHEQYEALLDILNDEKLVDDYKKKQEDKEKRETPQPNSVTVRSDSIAIDNVDINSNESSISSVMHVPLRAVTLTEDIIRCICGLFKDEGLMIQCSRCMVWQHTECTKADVNAENYLCEKCEPRQVDYEVPLEEFTEEGHRYYLTLMRGYDLQVRQGDAVYVLRDIPIKDEAGNIIPTKKHTYETIGEIDYNECDIFRVERLWKDEEGKRLIFGHHFLRPHETFHEPSRKFYPNEVIRVPLYEVVPIELVIGRCWVLDRTTFCKGRPIECTDETHCFICELRVDKQARFFSKAKINYPTCTKSYAFRKFDQKLRISKTYAPHEIDPTLFKTKKSKVELDRNINDNNTRTALIDAEKITLPPTTNSLTKNLNCTSKTSVGHKLQLMDANPKPIMTLKQKRLHLENVLKAIKEKHVAGKSAVSGSALNLSYLLTSRGARQRKIQTQLNTTN